MKKWKVFWGVPKAYLRRVLVKPHAFVVDSHAIMVDPHTISVDPQTIIVKRYYGRHPSYYGRPPLTSTQKKANNSSRYQSVVVKKQKITLHTGAMKKRKVFWGVSGAYPRRILVKPHTIVIDSPTLLCSKPTLLWSTVTLLWLNIKFYHRDYT